MNRLFGRVVVFFCGAIAAGPVIAADMPFKAPPVPVAVSDWSGFYVGADVGARFTDPTWTTTSWTFFGFPCAFTVACDPTIPTGTFNFPFNNSSRYDGIGFRGGVYGGYNWQFANWVAGLEGDFGWGNNKVSQTGVAPGPLPLAPGDFPPGIGDATTVKTTWDASARARLGYLIMPSFLLYATGGPAWQHVDLSASCASLCPFNFGPTAAPTFAAASTTKLGWVVGGGGELKFWGNWIGRAEYTYAHFDNIAFNYAYMTNIPGLGFAPFTGSGVSYTTNLSLSTHTFVVGLAYKFGPP